MTTAHKLFTAAFITAAVIAAAYVAASLIRVPRTAIAAELPQRDEQRLMRCTKTMLRGRMALLCLEDEGQ